MAFIQNTPWKDLSNINYLLKLENVRHIGWYFLGLGRALWVLDENDPKTAPQTDGWTDERGVNEALIVRLDIPVEN